MSSMLSFFAICFANNPLTIRQVVYAGLCLYILLLFVGKRQGRITEPFHENEILVSAINDSLVMKR